MAKKSGLKYNKANPLGLDKAQLGRFMIRKILLYISIVLLCGSIEAKLPEIDHPIVLNKMHEIMKMHATHKELNSQLIRRTLQNYLEELDPNKTYFIKSDIYQWFNPTESLVRQVLNEYNQANFRVFEEMHEAMVAAINRRHELEKLIDLDELPDHVNPEEFKDMQWVENEDELLARLSRIKALQIETASKLTDDLKERSFQRIVKNQAKYEKEILTTDTKHKQRLILATILKATTAALDSHTSYFTPDEATQFMISVQQRLFGIGAQLRDDLNGFTVIKIIEGGPAANDKALKVKDRIVAVDEEPVVGMDIGSAVELIRGRENTPVMLTVIREITSEDINDEKKEEKLDITIMRGEVVLKETRYESSYEPYGDGVVAYLRLFSFYQDPESSSANDLANEIQKLKSEHKVKGLILDLRYNSGGMLSQAVGVTGLFITKGIVVGIRDNTGHIQYLRDLDGKTAWDGPLIVLVNRASASASEIVSQTLQDYGRAIVVGDDHTYGKGSFQTFTLNANKSGQVNPQGEYKVTRGMYFTVSGKTPQLTGVLSDIVVSGPLSKFDIGEQYAKYPLENDSITPNYDDDLSDIPYMQRQKIKMLYKFDLQKKLTTYDFYINTLKKNSEYRISNNNNYQNFLKELEKEDIVDEGEMEHFGQNDLQLTEAYNVMKDLILLMQ